jgi:hypothetical protein
MAWVTCGLSVTKADAPKENRMRTPFPIAGVLLGLCLAATQAAASTALQITFQVDAGTPVTIADSNDGVSDLNPDDATIDVVTTIDGVVTVDGSLDQYGGLGHVSDVLSLGSRTLGGTAVFHNTDVTGHRVTVTIDSETFDTRGPALGWAVSLYGTADDASGGDVEIEPLDDLQAFADPGSGFVSLFSGCVGGPNDGATCASASECPDGGCGGTHVAVPLTAAADQPVDISTYARGVDRTGTAVRSRLVWTFDAGPDDEIRLPDYGLEMAVFKAQDACVYGMNKAATNVVKTAEAIDVACLKTTGDVTACVDGQSDGETARDEKLLAKFIAKFRQLCTVPPAFGANLGSCCRGGGDIAGAICADSSECASGACTAGVCIYGGAEQAANAITHDLFGATVSVSDAAKRCERYVRKAAAAVHLWRWRVFTAVKKANISQLTTEASFINTCLGPPQPDPKEKIARYETKLTARVQKCIDDGITPLSTIFPGACASEPDSAYAACIARRVACRFCLGAKVVDDLVSPLDCDLFDDGVANSSCP